MRFRYYTAVTMRYSQSFIPTLKEPPREASVRSHQLMLRAGMIHQNSSGLYTWLPYGIKLLQNIEAIIRNVFVKFGFNEVLMPTIQSADLWQQSGRYDAYGKEMLRIKDRHDNDLLYSPTCEEQITAIFKAHVKTYKQLPQRWYHIQSKFRDEIRPRFGMMRAREFMMMDAYSFDLGYEQAVTTYEMFFRAYNEIFQKIGIVAIPVKADTGAIGGDLSHEFHVIANTGESALYYDKKLASIDPQNHSLQDITSIYAVADDMHNPDDCPVASDDLICKRGIEVGHIFYFADKYSKPLNATVIDKDQNEQTIHMGSYGIGVSRLAQAIVEALSDDRGIVLPSTVAPYTVILSNISPKDQATTTWVDQVYETLRDNNISVLYDDRADQGVGAKFANAELLGAPFHFVIGKRLLEEKKIEVVRRHDNKKFECNLNEAMSILCSV